MKSKEIHINDGNKLRLLNNRRYCVFRARSDKFHWNLTSCAVNNTNHVSESFYLYADDHEENDEVAGHNFNLQEKVRDQVNYSFKPKVSYANASFVAVREKELGIETPVCIRNVVQKISDKDGSVCTLCVH